MEKDQAVRNQKVFIRLDAVLELQRDYARAIASEKEHMSRAHNDGQAGMYRKGLARAIALLELPIPD